VLDAEIGKTHHAVSMRQLTGCLVVTQELAALLVVAQQLLLSCDDCNCLVALFQRFNGDQCQQLSWHTMNGSKCQCIGCADMSVASQTSVPATAVVVHKHEEFKINVNPGAKISSICMFCDSRNTLVIQL